MRRVPFWAQALALCALFAIAGVAILDDYGVGYDGPAQCRIANANLAYIATGDISKISQARDVAYRYYGLAHEMPLLLAERALRLQDRRHIYLTRHFLTHLLFIAGGFACGMLAYRMLGNRWIALFTMLIFLLHPRLYAHSFFNTKDIPFAAMLLIALYLAHHAFRKDTIGAFLLCGIGAGLAINLRPFGLILLPLMLAMRSPDLWNASGWADRKRVLITGGIFAAAALATLYITHPYYWENPLRFIEGLRVLSQHPNFAENLFMGKIYPSDAVPWNYIPVWFAITAPPVALALGAIGCAAVCWQTITRPIAALRDRETRFGVMLIACFALPVIAVIALQANIYDGWRQMYFLWTPFCLLAAVGLHRIANIRMGGGIWKIAARLPAWARGGGICNLAPRALACGIACAGIITTATAMFALHPHQQVYFNPLVDTSAPGALAQRYDMDYWQISQRQALEYLLTHYPAAALRVWMDNPNRQIMPQNDRERIPTLESLYAADFYLWSPRWRYPLPVPNPQEVGSYHPLIDLRNIQDMPLVHSVRAYDSPIALIYGKDAHAYNAAYADIAANGDPLAHAAFDIYAYDGALYYLSADCPPPAPNSADQRIFLHLFPEDPADLPAIWREHGFENHEFWFNPRAAFFNGKCIIIQPLPAYPIARVDTGRFVSGNAVWRVGINLAARAAAQATDDGIANGDYGQPVAQSDFDVYLRGDTLAYIKTPCAPGDADARFFLHIIPVDPADLSGDWRERGFDNLDFQFADHGALIGDKCVATLELPDYAIDRIRTGQFVGGEGSAWGADIDLAAQALHESIVAGDYGQAIAQSDFDVYLRGNSLAYFKENCEAGDADARFFLHIIPADPADLSGDWRERGFANLDFRFAEYGADIGGKCVAERELPDYAIARIITGHNAMTAGGDGWRADIDLAAHAAAQALYAGITAGDYGQPVARADFDVYLRGNTLAYLKESCAEGDADERFFLHIIPADPRDLPADRRESGYANLDFQFADHGAYAGDKCVAERELPDYAIERISTGQFVSGEGRLWSAEFPVGR